MVDLVVHPSSLAGSLTVPPSKSQMHRALLFATFAKGKSVIQNPLLSPDIAKLIEACCFLGAEVMQQAGEIVVEGNGGVISPENGIVNVGGSGISLRFLTGLLAHSSESVLVTGEEGLKQQRSVADLAGGLARLGGRVTFLERQGFAPFSVAGPLRSGDTSVNGRDSQTVSALLLAALFSKGTTSVFVEEPGELPYVEMTLNWIRRFTTVTEKNAHSYTLTGPVSYSGFSYQIPGDFSSTLFPVVAALVTRSQIEIRGLDFSDTQGDKKVLDWLQEMGAKIERDEQAGTLHVDSTFPLEGCEIDLNECIDALPILAVLGCFTRGKMCLTNAKVAREKECDRISAIVCELGKMGALIKEKEDGLIVSHSPLKAAESLQSYGDHRMALSLIVAALGATGTSSVSGVECIDKTYPHFVSEMQKMGARLS